MIKFRLEFRSNFPTTVSHRVLSYYLILNPSFSGDYHLQILKCVQCVFPRRVFYTNSDNVLQRCCLHR